MGCAIIDVLQLLVQPIFFISKRLLFFGQCCDAKSNTAMDQPNGFQIDLSKMSAPLSTSSNVNGNNGDSSSVVEDTCCMN